MRSFTLVPLLALVAACSSEPSKPAPASVDAKTSHLAPPFQAPSWKLVSDPHLPVVDSQVEMMQGIDFILTYADDPRLQSSEDRAAMALLRAYRDGRRPLNVALATVGDDYGNVGRMAYACKSDLYVIMPGMRSSLQMFAVTFYHEVQHAAQCDAKLARLGIDRAQADERISTDPCEAEPPAYAAGARLMQALIDRGQQPVRFSPIDRGDVLSLNVTYDAWYALSQDRFCSWYRSLHKPAPR